MKKLFVSFLFLLCGIVSNADAITAPCLAAIGADDAGFINPMYNNVLGGKPPIQENIDINKIKMFNLVADNVKTKCFDASATKNDFAAITQYAQFIIPFKYKDNKKYKMQVDTSKMFEYLNLPVGFLVINNRKLTAGDIIKKSNMPTDWFYSNTCSSHNPRLNIANDAAINVAGQAAFGKYAGEKSEYFLDKPVGKSCRAFPGLVLGDFGGWGAAEGIVVYKNYLSAQKAIQSFHSALQNTPCSQQQDLAIYLVSLDNIRVKNSDQIPEWLVVANGLTGIGLQALLVEKLADIEELQILDGPYNIQ